VIATLAARLHPHWPRHAPWQLAALAATFWLIFTIGCAL
jgi:hypothetical protein